jgi:Rrf2 family iron-sulfur cluster assembly transcriptional regulator
MQLSTKGRYAVMALVDLAARQRGCAERSVTLADIAASQQLSLCYLEQLFAKLRRAGLVASARGPGGGYRLGRAASQIPIAAIIEAVDENLRTTRCDVGGPGCLTAASGAAAKCGTHDLWHELGQQICFFLSSLTLEDVVLGRVAGRAVRPGKLPVEAA